MKTLSVKNFVIKLFSAGTLLLAPSMSFSESVIDNPSRRVINLPIGVDDKGKPTLKFPSGPPKNPPRLIAACNIEDLKIQVVKENGQRRAQIHQIKEGQESVKVVPFVVTQKLTKDMLAQYSAAIVIAQALGLTEVDYIKIMLVDPQLQFQDAKVLVFFYDTDDDVIERTLVTGNQWMRCLEE